MSSVRERLEQKSRLMGLGVEVLAEGLLLFSDRHRDVADWIDRELATPDENLEEYYRSLKAFQEEKRYFSQSESVHYAATLTDLLETLERGAKDPVIGLQALVAFFTSDQAIIDCADDSWGEVGQVFSRDGVELFHRFAAECPDKPLILELLIDLLEDDSYGVRGDLIKEVSRFLSLADIQLLITQCRLKAEQAENNYRRSEWLNFAASLAEQVAGTPDENILIRNSL